MDNIINEIIDIDRRAQQKYIDADAYRKKTEDEILSEISRLDADTSKKCTDKLNAVRAAQEALYNERMESLSASLNQQKSALSTSTKRIMQIGKRNCSTRCWQSIN